MTVGPVTQEFIPGPRLIDGSDLNRMRDQINSALGIDATNSVITALDTVGAGTITAAGIVGGVTARGGAQSGTAFTDTTATAALIVAALPTGTSNGVSWLWAYQNLTNAQATLAGGSGVTLSGNTIIPKLTTATYLVTKTSDTAVTIQFVSAESAWALKLTGLTSINTSSGGQLTVQVAGLTDAQLATVTLVSNGSKVPVFPTAVDIIAGTPNARVGQTNQLTIRNPTALTYTLTGLVGTEVSGLSLVQPNTATVCQVTIASLSSVQIAGLTSTQLAV